MTVAPIDCFEELRWTPPLSVCVFCGAKPGVSPEGALAARTLGELLGKHGHNLIYGAGGVGLMDEVSRAASAAGSRVTGIAPRFLHQLDRVQQATAHEILVTDDMFQRKRMMIDRADAFIALPGGYGTLDEVLEVVSLAYLGQCAKPLALVDVDGTWDSLVSLFDDVHQRGFTRPGTEYLFQVVASPAEAVQFVERHSLVAAMAGDTAANGSR